MGKSKEPGMFEVESLIKGLQKLLDTLPSESQKQEINDAFTELISFLTDLQNIFIAMPSIEDVSQLRKSLLKIEDLYASLEKVPLIAASVGASRSSSKRNARVRPPKDLGINARQVLANLSKLPADEIRSQLGGKAYSKQSLRLIASEMGLKTSSNATRKSLADKIASDIVNQRLRDGLAGRPDRDSLVRS